MKAGVRSPTLSKAGLKGIARENSLQIDEATWTQIEADIDEEHDRKAQERELDRPAQVF